MLVRKFFRPCLALKKTSILTPCACAYHMTHVIMQKNNVELVTQESPNKLMFFKQLSSIIGTDIKKLPTLEALQILDVYYKTDAPYELKVINSLVRHVTKNVDKLSLIEISLFLTKVKKMQNIHLNKKLIDSLKQQFIIKLSTEFDDNNIDHLDYGLAFASNFSKNSKLLTTMLNKLENYNGEIPIENATTILETICKIQIQLQKCLKIYEKVKDVIYNNVEYMHPGRVHFIIHNIRERMKINNQMTDKFYDKKLCDKLIQKIVDDDVGLEKALNALDCFNSIKHKSKILLNYCSASYFEKYIMSEGSMHNSKIKEGELEKLLILIHGLALSQHETSFWNQIENLIVNRKKELLKYDHKTLCVFSLDLLCLNYYPYYLLEKVFDNKYDYSENVTIHSTFCKIYQRIKTDPKYDGPMPSQSQIKSLHQLNNKSLCREVKNNGQFYDLIVEALGDKKFIKTNLVTRLFHLIDYVVVFDENGDPVPINTSDNYKTNTKEYLEDLNIPPNCKIVCILNLPVFWYWKNTKKLLGTYAVSKNSLKTLNCSVVSLNKAYYIVSAEQRKAFLLNKIKSKLNSVKLKNVQ